MLDDLIFRLRAVLGPREAELVAEFSHRGQLPGYELNLPKEVVSEYVLEAARRGLVILGLDFFG